MVSGNSGSSPVAVLCRKCSTTRPNGRAIERDENAVRDYDVSRALTKGAKAVQIGSALAMEGASIFARLAREMRIARGERP